MLPTDAAMDHGAKCNAIQNALQKVEVCLSFEQAAIVLSELNKELTVAFRLRRKKAVESGKSTLNTPIAPCQHNWEVCDEGGGFMYNNFRCTKCGEFTDDLGVCG